MEDLVQVGYLGLIAAIERFDPQQRVSFLTFAVPTILGVIKHYLRDHTWAVKAPRRLRDLGMSLRRISERLEQRLGRPPTVAEMAAEAGVSEEMLLEAMELGRLYQSTSLDSGPTDESGEERSPFSEALGAADPQLAAVEEREALRRALEHLEPRQRTVIRQRFFLGRSQAEVGHQLGLSQMQISRLERQALQRLRSLLS
jgi:RNA polymerase sigma-B factor